MSDFTGGIKPLGPSYPVRPIQPVNKDRETGKRDEKRQQPDAEKPDSDDETTHIDEHV